MTPHLPPGPESHPLVQMRAWLGEAFPFLDRCRDRYGPTFTLRLFGYSPFIVTSDPEMVRAVFTADPAVMLGGKGNDVLLPFLGPNSLLTLDGPGHARDRKMITPPFHGQRMRAYGAAVQGATSSAIEGWRAGQTVATLPATQAASVEVILRAVFGITDDTRREEVRRALLAKLDTATPALLFLSFLRHDLGPWSPWGAFLRRREEERVLLLAAMERRRGAPGEDILSLLLAARDEAGEALTDEELYSELVTLLVAGHETTANALSWALAWIASEPEVRERLVAEIDAAGPDPEAVAKLPYLGAVCNEVLRIRPVFPLALRVLGADWTYGPWHLPAGHRVTPSIYLVHTRPDLYPDPHRFRPERFLERTFGPHEYIPFGGGARRCIGAAFALYEMKLALATLLARVRIDAVEAGPPEAIRRNLTMGPGKGSTIRIVEVRPGA